MKVKTLFLPLLLMACLSLSAQDALIRPFLDAWKVDDTSQTHRAQVFYDALRFKRDSAQYRQVVAALHHWLSGHPDKRLTARSIIYEALGAREFGLPTAQYVRPLQKAISYAHDLKDDQLLAEIYSLYAGIATAENYPLYNLKAIELMRRVGFSHFSYVHNRFFDVSLSLYKTGDYRQSIDYGLTCISLRDTDPAHWDDFIYLFQLDILGASYRELGRYDSVLYYYGQLESLLPNQRVEDERFRQIWTGIARGNRGHIFALQGKYAEALPLVKEHWQSSVTWNDPLNQTIAGNNLAYIYRRLNEPAQALNYWRQALQAAVTAQSPDHAQQAAKGIAELMQAGGRLDSALHYFTLYHTHKDAQAEQLGRNRLSALQARLAFDDLQHQLQQAQGALDATRFTRNVILVAIVVAAFIVLLLYNRYRLKHQLALQRIQLQQELAEQSALHSREQVAAFTNHIIEKNNLIAALQQQLVSKDQTVAEDEVHPALLQYTLFTDAEWENFKVEFTKAYPAFLPTLRSRVAQITPAEERLAALIYLQLNTYQIANTLGISRDSVLRSKRRLKKRLELPEAITVEEYIHNLLLNKQ